MKYKVGDKVKIKETLEIGKDYEEMLFVDDMAKYRGKTMTIKEIDEIAHCYMLKEDRKQWCWVDEMFEDKEMEIKEEMNNDVVKAIKELTKTIKSGNLCDEVIQDKIVEKAEKVPVEELTDKVVKKVEKIIKEQYGVLPKKIEIVNNDVKKEMTGIFHKRFNDIVNIVNKGVPLMLTGPAGAGKNFTLEQVAEALGLDFYFTNAVTQEYKLTGFIDANGVYQETQFYKAFKDGGLFFLDEVDASCPEALIILNSAIANKYFDFPNGKITANENFRVVCAGNTYGTGADMVYVGRNALDGATLDRFSIIEFDYDEDVEKQLAFDDELYNFVKDLRDTINKCSLRYIVSMRATINATKLLQIGMDKKSIIRSAIIKNMQIDDLNVIIKKLKEKNKNEWVKCLEEIINDRNK